MKALTVGVDTIKISGDVVGLSPAAFTSTHLVTGKDGRQFGKFVYNGRKHEPRVTYYPNTERLVVECSWPKFIYGDNARLIDDPALAIETLSLWLHRKFGLSVNVGDWHVIRIDYAADWVVGAMLPIYIEAFQRTQLSSHDRSDYEHDGVMWRSQSRAIKFYNKTSEQGFKEMASAVLRFELSHYRDSVRYICSSIGLDNSLTALASPSVVRKSLGAWLPKVMPIGFGADESVRAKVYELFPRPGQALEHLRLINQHGTNAYHFGFTNKSSYYRYLKALRNADLLGSSSSSSLPLLAI
jgi:hypothetical protein